MLPQAQSNMAKQLWAETSETMSQNKPFFLMILLSQVFVTVTEC
jgi:hypothetical protein